jgi:hypothetical protein
VAWPSLVTTLSPPSPWSSQAFYFWTRLATVILGLPVSVTPLFLFLYHWRETERKSLHLNPQANSLANRYQNPQDSYKSTRLVQIHRTRSDPQDLSKSTDLFRSTDSAGSTWPGSLVISHRSQSPLMISVLISCLLISLDPRACKLLLIQTHAVKFDCSHSPQLTLFVG